MLNYKLDYSQAVQFEKGVQFTAPCDGMIYMDACIGPNFGHTYYFNGTLMSVGQDDSLSMLIAKGQTFKSNHAEWCVFVPMVSK